MDLPLPPPHNYTLEHATREAVGVEMNRLQNIVITLDKVGRCCIKWPCSSCRHLLLLFFWQACGCWQRMGSQGLDGHVPSPCLPRR